MGPRTEGELLTATIDLAMLCRWAVCHQRAAQTARGWRTAVQGHSGMPDLVLARQGVLWLWELKGPRGQASPEQRDWAKQIGDQHYRLLRPGDWPWIQLTLTTKASSR